MITLILKDINGKELTLESKIRMIDEETEEAYGEISGVRLVQNDNHGFEIRAFETDLSYKIISNAMFAQEFIIVE